MKLETECPVCGRPVSYWRMLTAPHPWGIRCPHCKSKAKARDHSALVISVFLIMASLVMLFVVAALDIEFARELMRWQVWLVILLSAVFLELMLSLWIIVRGLRHY